MQNTIMSEEKNISVFDWQRIFLSENFPPAYLFEIVFKSAVMFILLIVGLKFLSKRGVKQLSVFELAILIALGSAIGDPMFYDYVPLTHGIVVLLVVILLYKIITGLTAKSKKIERILEGKPTCLLSDGKIEYENYKHIGLPYDKFFAELRLNGIEHLGQVQRAYLETSGEISVYMFEDEEVQPGLPIFPELVDNPLENIEKKRRYACIHCGNVEIIDNQKSLCSICHNDKWIVPKSNLRVR
ncbi:DUF421 domain-containing protein [Flavobacterium sp. GT3P67]|uniref:DUF421 domain-containing protein n=1 Tax=Flavobacterium sp. GT3P67 TaxID=2541722 RepID=UPI00104495E9|nr:YetF domain-containing protein [Flavobacterium sp. GT3P67]TDE55155.1 DUF421 domain-containing protein [Flavobacterium sp. GT3P67]